MGKFSESQKYQIQSVKNHIELHKERLYDARMGMTHARIQKDKVSMENYRQVIKSIKYAIYSQKHELAQIKTL